MKKFLSLMLVAVLAISATASPADAAFRLRVEDVGTGEGVVITDGGAGDLNPLANVITFVGSINANFTINVTTGLSTPALVAPGFYDAIDLNSVNVASTGAGTLRLILENDGFTNGPDGPAIVAMEVGGTLDAPAGSSVTFSGFANPGNLVPTLGPDTFPAGAVPAVPDLPPAGSAEAGPLVFDDGAFSGSITAPFVKAGPYSLFSSAVVSFTGAGSVSFDQMTGTVVPAPAGLVLLAAGAPFLALGYYRRKKAAVKA